jgi:hypothetical protein
MKERSIICTDEEVRAFLDGRKTEMRRPIRWPRSADTDQCLVMPPEVCGKRWPYVRRDGDEIPVRCPFGVPEDSLWVREGWVSWHDFDCEHQDEEPCNPHCRQTYVAYRATPRVGYRPVPDKARIRYLDESSPLERQFLGPWCSSATMPRWASRVTVEVVSVRAERVQDITDEGAAREGFLDAPIMTARENCRYSWSKRYGAGAWDRNDWVWVVGFGVEVRG